MLKISTATILTLALLIGCGSSKKMTKTSSNAFTQADADKYNTTIAALESGKMIYEAQCNKCHALKPLHAKNEDGWKSIVPKMVVKSNKKAGSVVITPEEEQKLLNYLLAASTKQAAAQ